ncbi:MAG: hypothetical protein ACI9QL_004745 [Candidatus Omnitrophota bacterium]|jgi:hypothetical protein
MHFVLSFEFEPDLPERHEALLTELETCFSEYESIRALGDTYVVQVMGYGVYEHVQRQLLEKARAVEGVKVRFLMSPLINRGLYHGRMSEEAALKINKLTD